MCLAMKRIINSVQPKSLGPWDMKKKNSCNLSHLWFVDILIFSMLDSKYCVCVLIF